MRDWRGVTRPQPAPAIDRGRAFFQEHSNLLLAQLDRVCEDTRRVASGSKRWLGIGFGRLLFHAPSITQQMVHEDPLVAALPAGHALLGAPVSLQQLAAEPFILYPGSPRPSYADHVLEGICPARFKHPFGSNGQRTADCNWVGGCGPGDHAGACLGAAPAPRRHRLHTAAGCQRELPNRRQLSGRR